MSSNTITNNTVSNNHNNGFYLLSSNGNTFNSNFVTGNDVCGFYLSSSSDNLFYDNYLENDINVDFEGSNTPETNGISNQYPENMIGGSSLGGNYWTNSDRTGFSDEEVDQTGMVFVIHHMSLMRIMLTTCH
ncbi:MAG: NosD domain-containing protein [Methanolobus sp.]